ncbi:MAG: dihydropteroate synthase [Nitrospirae bacterium]|nr:MAG: dihydropteroate synthase [Nitrospirota bacterium]
MGSRERESVITANPSTFSCGRSIIFRARDYVFPLDARVLIMGILNVTPDSFSDGGRFLDPQAALDRLFEMAEEGADVIDVGAESTRPGSTRVDETEELRRLLPLLRAIGHRSPVPLSIDTQKAAVARVALDHGVAIVNDISALRADAAMAQLVAESGAGVVLMHMQGEPGTMQQAPKYADVIQEVKAFLAQRLMMAEQAGIQRDQIVLDPGIGFGKNTTHNCLLVAHLDAFLELGRPLLIGVSRKTFIGRILGKPVEDRLFGTAGAVAVAVLHGAGIVRVHDVRAMTDVVNVVRALRKGMS